MALYDPINGLYRAGFAYNAKPQSARNTNISLGVGNPSATITLSVSETVESTQITVQAQVVADTANKEATVTLKKNQDILAVWKVQTGAGASGYFTVVDTVLPSSILLYPNDNLTLLIEEPDIGVGTSTTWSAGLGFIGVPF